MVGGADDAGLPPNRRLQFVGGALEIGRRAPDETARPAGTRAILNDTLVSGHHARIVQDRRRLRARSTSAARTAPGSTTCASRSAVKLRDGALIFIGNHVGVFRLASAHRGGRDQGRAGRLRSGPVATVSPDAGAWPAIGCAGWRRRTASCCSLGETGVGKEVYARAVHQRERAQGTLHGDQLRARSRASWWRASCSATGRARTRPPTRPSPA